MLTLYEHPLSAYAQKVKILLLEKGLEFEARLPAGIGSGTSADATFTSSNPRLEVPLLIDGETTLFDSTVIIEYLEERYPEPALGPFEPAARARMRTLEEVIDTHYEAITWGLAEIHYFKRAEGALADRLVAAATDQLSRLHAWLQDHLGEQLWLSGDEFGRSDLSAVPFVNGATRFDLGPEPGSPLADWQDRANARPSVAEVSAQASAAVGSMDGVAKIVEQGRFKRQYRDHRLEWMIRSGGLDIVTTGLDKDNIRFTCFP